MTASDGRLYRYVLITSARNEDEYIEKTIQSVLSQDVLPIKWVIVSDSSTDSTDSIIKQSLNECSFIEFLRRDGQKGRDFASKVHGINTAYERVRCLDYDFIGILDADITLESDYYRTIMDKYHMNPGLGIAGGYIKEKRNGEWHDRLANSIRSVAGAIQFFRREHFERMGGFIALSAGGEDWSAELQVRMQGYEVRSYPEIPVYHHKPFSSVTTSQFKMHYKRGKMDYSVGSHPIFELMKCARRITERPYVLGALGRLIGFLKSTMCCERRLITKEIVTFLRAEQLQRLRLKRKKDSAA